MIRTGHSPRDVMKSSALGLMRTEPTRNSVDLMARDTIDVPTMPITNNDAMWSPLGCSRMFTAVV
jgi:hypothetical protein